MLDSSRVESDSVTSLVQSRGREETSSSRERLGLPPSAVLGLNPHIYTYSAHVLLYKPATYYGTGRYEWSTNVPAWRRDRERKRGASATTMLDLTWREKEEAFYYRGLLLPS